MIATVYFYLLKVSWMQCVPAVAIGMPLIYEI